MPSGLINSCWNPRANAWAGDVDCQHYREVVEAGFMEVMHGGSPDMYMTALWQAVNEFVPQEH